MWIRNNVYLNNRYFFLLQVTCRFDANKCPPELQMDDGTGQKVCASICTAIHNTQQREKYTHLQDIYNNPDTRSLVCCSCDEDYCVRKSPFNDKNH